MSEELIKMESKSLKLWSHTKTNLSLDGARIYLNISGFGDKDNPSQIDQESLEAIEYMAAELNAFLQSKGFR